MILTSDHGWLQREIVSDEETRLARRPRDLQVPFLIHFPGQTQEGVNEQLFDAIVLHAPALGILSGQVTTLAGPAPP